MLGPVGLLVRPSFLSLLQRCCENNKILIFEGSVKWLYKPIRGECRENFDKAFLPDGLDGSPTHA